MDFEGFEGFEGFQGLRVLRVLRRLRGLRWLRHTCKKRVMLRRRLFWPKKIAEKVRKSRQNVNRDKSA